MPASGSPPNSDRTLALIEDLLATSNETACVEFKGSNSAPAVIGKYISALANARPWKNSTSGIWCGAYGIPITR